MSGLDSGNTAWLLISSVLVFFMALPGLALFYGGLVRSRSFLSVCMQCFSIASVASILWFLVGYSMVFGTSQAGLIGGLDYFALEGIGSSVLDTGVPDSAFVLFQMAFVVICPILVIGAWVERMRFSATLGFSALFVLFVYAPVAHWVWGGGFLSEGLFGLPGVIDFAGGLVVHITSGTAALVAALMIRSRHGFAERSTSPPHAPGLTLIGAAMLWMGWFGFNAGSALAADSSASMAAVVTHIAAVSGILAWVFIDLLRYGKATLVGAATGVIAGLVAITPAAASVGPLGAMILGALSSGFSYMLVLLVKSHFRVDDSLDVFAIHGGSGIAGSLLLVVLGVPALGGFGESEVTLQLLSQASGILVVIAWTGFITWASLKLLSKFYSDDTLTVDRDEEALGLDLAEHGERAYHEL